MTSSAILLAALFSTPGAGDGASTTRPAPQEPAPPPEYPQWSGALTLGSTWATGNTENTTFGGTLNAMRRAEKDRWTFDLYGNYGKTSTEDNNPATPTSTTNVSNYGSSLKYDYFWQEKTYLFGNGTGKIDHVAELDLRYTFGAGLGYQWRETEKVKWGTEAGLSYVDEDFEDDTADADFVAARLASNLTWQVSKSAAFEQVAEVLPSLEESEDLLAKLDNRLKLNITGKWIAQIQYVLEYDDSTPPGVEEADHRVVLGIGWSFGP
jgi:putative salt-induced outer membrane protein YdiY